KDYLVGLHNLKDGSANAFQGNAVRHLSSFCKQTGKTRLGADICTLWVDLQKSVYGPNSLNWMEALHNSVSYCPTNRLTIELKRRKREIASIPVPEKSAELLRFLRLQAEMVSAVSRLIGPEAKPDVSAWMTDVPRNVDGAQCYVVAAGICNSIKLAG